jgi:2-iminobutanoate/2-iminopropanoate deaminase
MKSAVSSPDLPGPVGPYSPAVRAGEWLFVSGQIPVNPGTGRLVEGGVQAETRQVLENLRTLLGSAGLSLADVVRTTVFLADMNDFQAMNEAYADFFAQPYPARTTIQAARLPRDVSVEIDAIALVPST